MFPTSGFLKNINNICINPWGTRSLGRENIVGKFARR